MTCSGEEREKVREFKYLKSTVIGRDKTEINVDVSERTGMMGSLGCL